LSVQKDGSQYFASLEIKNVTVEDAGKYKVTAKNELGESNATITLNFDSKFQARILLHFSHQKQHSFFPSKICDILKSASLKIKIVFHLFCKLSQKKYKISIYFLQNTFYK
jgi:hypothetical protein